MNRTDVTAKVLEAKRQVGLTWKQLAEALGTGSPVFYTAALLGQQTLTIFTSAAFLSSCKATKREGRG